VLEGMAAVALKGRTINMRAAVGTQVVAATRENFIVMVGCMMWVLLACLIVWLVTSCKTEIMSSVHNTVQEE